MDLFLILRDILYFTTGPFTFSLSVDLLVSRIEFVKANWMRGAKLRAFQRQ